MKKAIKFISAVVLSAASVSASASMMYDKQELIHNISRAVSVIEQVQTNNAPIVCLSHIKSAYSHANNAKAYAYADDSIHTFNQLIKSEKSLVNLKFEGSKCERQSYQSKYALALLQIAEHQLEIDGLTK